MVIRISDHARERMEQRGIFLQDVEMALRHSTETLPGQPGSVWKVGHAPGGRLLKVCVSLGEPDYKVITAAWLGNRKTSR